MSVKERYERLMAERDAKKSGSSNFKNKNGGSDKFSPNPKVLVSYLESGDERLVLGALKGLDALSPKKRKELGAYDALKNYVNSRKDLSEEEVSILARYLVNWADDKFSAYKEIEMILNPSTACNLFFEIYAEKYEKINSDKARRQELTNLLSGIKSKYSGGNIVVALGLLIHFFENDPASRVVIKKNLDEVAGKCLGPLDYDETTNHHVRVMALRLIGDVDPSGYTELSLSALEKYPGDCAGMVFRNLDKLDEEQLRVLGANKAAKDFMDSGVKIKPDGLYDIGTYNYFLASVYLKSADRKTEAVKDLLECYIHISSKGAIASTFRKSDGVTKKEILNILLKGVVSDSYGVCRSSLGAITVIFKEDENSRPVIRKHLDNIKESAKSSDLSKRFLALKLLATIDAPQYSHLIVKEMDENPISIFRLLGSLKDLNGSDMRKAGVHEVLEKVLENDELERYINKRPESREGLNPRGLVKVYLGISLSDVFVRSAENKKEATKKLLRIAPVLEPPFIYRSSLFELSEKLNASDRRDVIDALFEGLKEKDKTALLRAMDWIQFLATKYDLKEKIDANMKYVIKNLGHEDKAVSEEAFTFFVSHHIEELKKWKMDLTEKYIEQSEKDLKGFEPEKKEQEAGPASAADDLTESAIAPVTVVPLVKTSAVVYARLFSKVGRPIRLKGVTSDKLEELAQMLYEFKIGKELKSERRYGDKSVLELLGLIDGEGGNKIQDIFVETLRYKLLGEGDAEKMLKEAKVIGEQLEGSERLSHIGYMLHDVVRWNESFLFAIASLGDEPFEMNRNYHTASSLYEAKFNDLVKTVGKIRSAATDDELLKAVDEFKEKGGKLRKLCGS